MKLAYLQIGDLVADKHVTLEQATLKAAEEFGELVQGVNRTIGIKNMVGLSPAEVKANVLEEIADTIQNVLSIGVKYGFTFEEIEEELLKKNKKWRKS
jgi:NTP pyrophosphatase (non-canonical NTP hydrolase)